MKIDDLTIGEAKKLATIFQGGSVSTTVSEGLSTMVGKKVIVRTYSAGVFFGEIGEKDGSEVILRNARRLWRWHAAESISLSSIALHGLNLEHSKIVEAVPEIWLNAIELIPCSPIAVDSIENAENVEAS